MKDTNALEISDWLRGKLSEILNVPAEHIHLNEDFSNYGLTSISAVCLMGDLEKWLGRPMIPTLTYDHPTITLLSKHLADE